jgi:hypothetical protein|tara:strand:+ start:1086 stop:1532 length:447 start_codon:yes stop_codon:yes gene_type:complete
MNSEVSVSSFWTPSGEHKVPGAESPSSQPIEIDDSEPADNPYGADVDPQMAAAMEQRMREAQEQLLSVPASQVVANHMIGLFELAALHLRVDPPNLEEARLPIDAMGLVVDNLGSELPDADTIKMALQQIRLAYVEVQKEFQSDADED